MARNSTAICIDREHLQQIRRLAMANRRNCRQQLDWMLDDYFQLLEILEIPAVRSAIIRAKRQAGTKPDSLSMAPSKDDHAEHAQGVPNVPGFR